MNRPWKIWLAFGLCAAVLLAAMGWISGTALRLDRAQLQAAQRAEIEERVRLALWRMDSALAPIIESTSGSFSRSNEKTALMTCTSLK